MLDEHDNAPALQLVHTFLLLAVVSKYPAAQVVMVVASEHDYAPDGHATHALPTNTYFEAHVNAVEASEHVGALDGHATQLVVPVNPIVEHPTVHATVLLKHYVHTPLIISYPELQV